MRMYPCQRIQDRVGQSLRILFMRSDPRRRAVERAARIFAAEHRKRIFLRACIAEDTKVRMIALQDRDRRIEHHGGVDLALLHRRNRGRAKANADDGGAGGIEAVFLQEIFEKEIGRGAGSADADFLAGEILDRFYFAIVRR